MERRDKQSVRNAGRGERVERIPNIRNDGRATELEVNFRAGDIDLQELRNVDEEDEKLIIKTQKGIYTYGTSQKKKVGRGERDSSKGYQDSRRKAEPQQK